MLVRPITRPERELCRMHLDDAARRHEEELERQRVARVKRARKIEQERAARVKRAAKRKRHP
jgi:hypothetical protein